MIQTLENSIRPYVEAHPQTWSQYLTLAKFVANNVVNVATGYSPFYLNAGDHPLVPSALMYGGCVSSGVEAVQTMVDRMKIALEEAQANLSVAQHKAQIEHLNTANVPSTVTCDQSCMQLMYWVFTTKTM